MTWLEAVILAIVEGITEFLPVSSTGHMIIASALMGVEPDALMKNFVIIIQFGAILSVLALYWKRFFKDIQFYVKLFIAFIPAMVFGLLLNDWIEKAMETPVVVGINLFLGGIFLLFVDRIFNRNETRPDKEPTYKNAAVIGLFQVLAMIPGVSRSAATIVGGLTQKLNRKSAAEFSFFLAVPTMMAATGYKVFKMFTDETQAIPDGGWGLILLGCIVAFVVAMLAIRFFIGFLTRYGFKWFGWYRILAGGIIIILYLAGIELQLV